MTITFLDKKKFQQIPKIFVFSLYYDRWSNKLLSTVSVSFSWHVCLKDIGHNVE